MSAADFIKNTTISEFPSTQTSGLLFCVPSLIPELPGLGTAWVQSPLTGTSHPQSLHLKHGSPLLSFNLCNDIDLPKMLSGETV